MAAETQTCLCPSVSPTVERAREHHRGQALDLEMALLLYPPSQALCAAHLYSCLEWDRPTEALMLAGAALAGEASSSSMPSP